GQGFDGSRDQANVEVPGDEAAPDPRGARRPEGAARTGDPGGAGAAPEAAREGGSGRGQPEAGPEATGPRAGGVRQGEPHGGQRAAARRQGGGQRPGTSGAVQRRGACLGRARTSPARRDRRLAASGAGRDRAGGGGPDRGGPESQAA